jgi:hypothetical protein
MHPIPSTTKGLQTALKYCYINLCFSLKSIHNTTKSHVILVHFVSMYIFVFSLKYHMLCNKKLEVMRTLYYGLVYLFHMELLYIANNATYTK